MAQRVDPPNEFAVPGKVQRTIQQSWTIRTGDGVRMPLMITGHGHAVWTRPFAAKALIQPQDGAVDTRANLPPGDPGIHESEDAKLTGETRSLDRRLLGLNIVQDYLKRDCARITAIPSRINAEVA